MMEGEFLNHLYVPCPWLWFRFGRSLMFLDAEDKDGNVDVGVCAPLTGVECWWTSFLVGYFPGPLGFAKETEEEDSTEDRPRGVVDRVDRAKKGGFEVDGDGKFELVIERDDRGEFLDSRVPVIESPRPQEWNR